MTLRRKLQMILRIEAFVKKHQDANTYYLEGLKGLRINTLQEIDEAMAKADARIAELEAEIVALHEDAAGADI